MVKNTNMNKQVNVKLELQEKLIEAGLGSFEITTMYEEIQEDEFTVLKKMRVESDYGISIDQIEALNLDGIKFEWVSSGIQKQLVLVFDVTNVEV